MATRSPIPYSGARELRSFDPLQQLHREMDRLFDVFSGVPGGLAGGTSQAGLMAMPHIDVHEDEREIAICAELPGVKPADVDLRIEGDVLTISGEKKFQAERKQENMSVTERSFGRFRRSVQLPFAPDPDQVRAECDHGVLTVHVPRQPQQERSRRIEVRGSADAGGSQPGATVDEARGDDGPRPH